MIRTLTLLCASLFVLPLMAAQGGPDSYGYTWKDSNEPDGPVFDWVDISITGSPVTGLADDNIVGPFVMQTDMPFYWYGRKFLWIGSNGYIAFNNQGNIASPFPTIPMSGGVNDYIAGLTADMNFTGTGNNARCYLFDDLDRTIISYVGVPFWSSASPGYTGSNSFQIILSKVDSSITVQILEQTGLTQNNDLVMGIESVAGSIGLQHSADVYPVANYAIRYKMPIVSLLEVNDAAANWVTAPGSGGLFRSRNGAALPLIANTINTGNTTLTNVTVTGDVLNQAGAVLSSAQQTVSSLLSGGNATVVFDGALDPTTSGTYRLRSTVSNVPNDLALGNNTRVQEVVVLDTTTATHDLRFHSAADDGLGLSWDGGNGGVGVFIRPPYYPARAIATTVRIVSNTGASAFTMKVYADDGDNFSPGTLLDSVYIAAGLATPGDKVIPLSAPLTITGGGVYVQWYMMGPNVSIAQDITPPFSLRTYEVLDGTWSPYRDAENVDFHLGLRLEQSPVYDVACTGFFGSADGQEVAAPAAVRIWLSNNGNQPTTGFPISYQYGSAPAVTQTYSGTLAPGAQELVTFNVAFTPTGDASDTLCAWANWTLDSNTANDTSCVQLQTWVGIEELTATTVQLWPNPAREAVSVNGLPAGTYRFTLLDATGRTVRDEQVQATGGPFEIQLGARSEGFYMAQFIGVNARYRASVVVQH